MTFCSVRRQLKNGERKAKVGRVYQPQTGLLSSNDSLVGGKVGRGEKEMVSFMERGVGEFLLSPRGYRRHTPVSNGGETAFGDQKKGPPKGTCSGDT